MYNQPDISLLHRIRSKILIVLLVIFSLIQASAGFAMACEICLSPIHPNHDDSHGTHGMKHMPFIKHISVKTSPEVFPIPNHAPYDCASHNIHTLKKDGCKNILLIGDIISFPNSWKMPPTKTMRIELESPLTYIARIWPVIRPPDMSA